MHTHIAEGLEGAIRNYHRHDKPNQAHRQSKKVSLPENIIRGLQSLVGGNANLIIAMLDVDKDSSETVLVDKLVDCMS